MTAHVGATGAVALLNANPDRSSGSGGTKMRGTAGAVASNRFVLCQTLCVKYLS